MLSSSEKVAICTILQIQSVEDENVKFSDYINQREITAEQRIYIVTLRYEIDELINEKQYKIDEINKRYEIIRDDYQELKNSVTSFVYKIIENKIMDVTNMYEFKEVKSLLNIY